MIPCLSNGLAKNYKAMSLFVLFPAFLSIMKVWLFPEKEVQPYTKTVKHGALVNFSKVQQLRNNLKKAEAFLTKK